jgi:N-acyl-D-amino-acid deacylase
MQCDLLVAGGTVVDGTGADAVVADVSIKDGKILAIGQLTEVETSSRLEAAGLLVTPGFIDIHSHSDLTLILDPRAVSSISQGVTLEVVGNCGHGCAPIRDVDLVRSNIYGCKQEHELDWTTMAGYLERLEAGKPGVNVLSLVANGNLRLAAAGLVDRPSTAAELAEMKRMLEQGLEEGAFGYSTGLEYGPERECPEQEIAELCRVTRKAGGFYATHTRNIDGDPAETIDEAIRTARAASIALQISHISVVSRLADDGRWAIEQALRQVDQARQSGLDVDFDMHTRLFGTTNLSAVLPPWALEGTKAEISHRLAEASTRSTLKESPNIISALARGDWSRIVIFNSRFNPGLATRSIAEISDDRGTEPLDTIYDILRDEVEDLHSTMIVAFTYNEDDVRLVFEHPRCMVGSDATALAPDGPLANSSFHGAYTWASWFFRYFVRDQGMLTQEEAVRRLSGLPAQRLGLADRGLLKPGMRADVAIFDPAEFAERGTTFEPNQTASGMAHVIVNGEIAVEKGELTGIRSGQVLRSR